MIHEVAEIDVASIVEKTWPVSIEVCFQPYEKACQIDDWLRDRYGDSGVILNDINRLVVDTDKRFAFWTPEAIRMDIVVVHFRNDTDAMLFKMSVL